MPPSADCRTLLRVSAPPSSVMAVGELLLLGGHGVLPARRRSRPGKVGFPPESRSSQNAIKRVDGVETLSKASDSPRCGHCGAWLRWSRLARCVLPAEKRKPLAKETRLPEAERSVSNSFRFHWRSRAPGAREMQNRKICPPFWSTFWNAALRSARFTRRASSCCAGWVISSAAFFFVFNEATPLIPKRGTISRKTPTVADITLPDGWPTMRSFAT